MNRDMHGKMIDYIELNPMWTYHGNPERVAPGKGQSLQLSYTHHGDHDQIWIVLSEGDREVSRYNPDGVQHIRWSAQGERNGHD
jgi:hypothetical protein